MTAPSLRTGLVAAAAGGVLGSLARYGLGVALPAGDGFPWVVFAVNVAGSAALAALPLLDVVRRTPWLAVFLGAGVLGGFTTMSAASEQTVVLLDHGHRLTAALYCAGTLLAALAAAGSADRVVSRRLPADAVR